MATETNQQEFGFQAEIKQLLHLLSHSLYQNREIAIRELISNASDALDKFRHITLTDEQYRDEAELRIELEPDKEKNTLIIKDNGVGMTRDELIQNLGTIAHSGSKEFLKNQTGDSKQDLSLIGQFGVGFYSSFMLASKVEVITRSYQDEQGWKWTSEGTGNFTIEEAENVDRGTQIVLHLTEEQKEFSESARIKHVLNTYSTFIPHPIMLDGEHVNNQPPIWVEPKSQLDDEKYNNFYQYLTHRTDEKPLWHLHISSDSPFQFHTIMYCPKSNFEKLGFGGYENGLQICAKRILVDRSCREVLPEYLRFLSGLVDSADLPLNVSRESLQDNTVFRKIRKVLVKQILGFLEKMAENEPDKYEEFYKEFGVILREGLHNDFENRDRLAGLLRFRSSNNPEKLTSLDAYLDRAPESQEQIYYISGTDLESIKRNPNLEIFNKKKIEVFYLSDPVDEIVLANLMIYKDHKITSIDSSDVDLSDEPEKDSEDSTEEKSETKTDSHKGFDRVLELFKEAIGDKVEDIRESKRLTESSCCLVNPSGNVSTHLQKVLSMSQQQFEMSKHIFEVNPESSLVKRLRELSVNPDNDEFIKKSGTQLLSVAMLQAGLVPDINEMASSTDELLRELASGKSSIST